MEWSMCDKRSVRNHSQLSILADIGGGLVVLSQSFTSTRQRDSLGIESSSFKLGIWIRSTEWKNINIMATFHDFQGMEKKIRDQVGVQDFVLLDDVSEESFLANLRKRAEADSIYVSGTSEFCIRKWPYSSFLFRPTLAKCWSPWILTRSCPFTPRMLC